LGVVITLLLCVSYVVLTPSFSLVPSVRLYNEKRLLQIGILVLSGGALLLSGVSRRQWLSVFFELPKTARLGLASALSLVTLSAVLAPASFYAFLEVGHYLLLFAVAGSVAVAVRREPEWSQRVLFGAVVVGAVLYVTHFAVGYGMYLSVEGIEIWPDGATNFDNIRFFNHYQTWTLPLLGGALLSLPSNWLAVKGGLFGVLSLWWTLLFASVGQGTIVALGIAAIGVGIIFRRRSLKWLGMQGGAVLVGWALHAILLTTVAGTEPAVESVSGDQFSGDHSYRRLDFWKTCLDMARAHPWLGVGPMHFAWPPYQFNGPASPHSLPMRVLAEWGIVSTGIVGGTCIWGGWQWVKQEMRRASDTLEKSGSPVSVALIASVLAGAAHSVVSGLFVAPLSQVLLVVIGGWAWGRFEHSSGNSFLEMFSFQVQTALCVLIAASTGVVGASLHDLAAAEERREAFVEAADRSRFSPRYWTQGYLQVRDPSIMSQVSEED
jgi:O-antigen ligase